MTRWSPGRLQLLGYVLGSIGALLVAVVAASRPRMGPVLLALAVILVIGGGVAIWLAQRRGTRSWATGRAPP